MFILHQYIMNFSISEMIVITVNTRKISKVKSIHTSIQLKIFHIKKFFEHFKLLSNIEPALVKF